ncbi:MAG: 50S ribosomal protein L5 [Patescibacteria group bacterium]|nr:50S ribosomal protein L5 [Patescibacteria group bacterium]MCL5093971.1 50S ribosomal protein L5 [Patescibacteria group bacterium]
MSKLEEKYNKEIKKSLKEKFGYSNIFEIPRVKKIVVNAGVGRAVADQKFLEFTEERLALVTGQKPIRTVSKKSIAGFKLREKMPIGVQVTLRGKRMYDFLDKLINIALPRVRDFRGIKLSAFDKKGNYSLGIRDHMVFPEISYEDQGQSFSLQVNIGTTAKNNKEAKALLEEMGFKFEKAKEVTNG